MEGPMSDDPETAAAEAINAHLADGHETLSAEECRVRYGAAFEALVSLLSAPAKRKPSGTSHSQLNRVVVRAAQS
jgi:hypothetical protein